MSLIQKGFIVTAILLTVLGFEAVAGEFEDAALKQYEISSRFPVPRGHEPGFQLSQKYPKTLAQANKEDPGPFAWQTIDFRKEPVAYMRAILAYVLEGNTSSQIDFSVELNPVRKWYHTPWMHFDSFQAREPIHGLTQERRARPFELHRKQNRRWRNWAVGFYNPIGAVTIGKFWSDPANPDLTAPPFAVGSVSAKLLFTEAPVQQVPYLRGSKTWWADINRDGKPVELRLLQLDIAVRDKRADDQTGWVFGTFMYHDGESGATIWDKLLPVGIMWGNDPDLTAEDVDTGEAPEEGWVNPRALAVISNLPRRTFGFRGRMNGPVDNPQSACLACHGRAMNYTNETRPPFAPTDEMINNGDEAAIRHFFRNLKPDEPFETGFISFDYSLQLADGYKAFTDWKKSWESGRETPVGMALHSLDFASRNKPLSQSAVDIRQLGADVLEKGFGRGETFPRYANLGNSVLRVEGEVTRPLSLTLADLALMNRAGALVKNADGSEHVYEGALLADILLAAGVPLRDSLKGKHLRLYVKAISCDDFGVVFALPEFDAVDVVVADSKDNLALGPKEGPLRLILAKAQRRGRWVKCTNRIVVERAPE